MGVVSCGTTMLDQGVFQNIGAVTWDTTAKTTTVNAVSGNGYFINTTSGAITVNLPAGSAGDIVALADYAATWQTNAVTVTPNGTDKIGGLNVNVTLTTEGQSVTFVYVDSTQGWVNVIDSTSNVRGQSFITATGGTITTSGDYKIHSFTGPGTFTVCSVGSSPTVNFVDYLVVAGGGAGGYTNGDAGGAGGGGGGGFRESSGAASGCYTTSPLGSCVSALPVSATTYPITVGGGGTAPVCNTSNAPGKGSNSVFSTITSTGGGGGATNNPCVSGAPGGSGGGGSNVPGANTAGSGNTPPVSPPQGQNGGIGTLPEAGTGGGGGAGEAGVAATPSSNGRGGAGVSTFISTSSLSYSGGGGGGGTNPVPGGSGTAGAASPCGTGGAGANYSSPTSGTAGTANRGGAGGAGGSGPGPDTGGNGGSGIVIIRYRYQ